MKIIAIDPGYDRVGIAVIEKQPSSKEVVLFSECFETDKKDIIQQRLYRLGKRVSDLIVLYKPSILVLEDLFFSKNTKTALKVSEARGIITYIGIKQGLDFCEFTPNQIKTAVTGYGLANKKDVHFMVEKILSEYPIKGKKDDEVDALALGITFFASYRGIHK